MDTVWVATRDGDDGIKDTLRGMGELARAGAVQPFIRNRAAAVVRGAPLESTRAELLAQWIGGNCEFLPDPTFIEALVPPWVSLDSIETRGYFQGDCDDVAVLAAALGLTIGLRARFIAVAFQERNAPYSHVFTELSPVAWTEWIPVDPTRPPQGLLSVTRRMIMPLF